MYTNFNNDEFYSILTPPVVTYYFVLFDLRVIYV